GNDAAEPDPRPDAEHGLGDRARLRDDRDPASPEGVRHGSDPDRRLRGGGDTHAVRPEQNGVLGPSLLRDPRRDLGPGGPRLVAETREEEGAHTRAERLLESLLDALV